MRQQSEFLRNPKLLDLVSLFARFFLAAMWIFAGWKKMQSKIITTQSVEGYDIFSDAWAHWIAVIIGPLEVAGGLLLLLGIFMRFAGWVSTVVLVLFIVGLAQAWARGLQIDCGCFGEPDPEKLGTGFLGAILRDIGFIFLSLWVVYRPYRKFALHP